MFIVCGVRIFFNVFDISFGLDFESNEPLPRTSVTFHGLNRKKVNTIPVKD